MTFRTAYRTGPVALLVCAALFAILASAARADGPSPVGFDDQPDGTQVTTQYEQTGVDFGPGLGLAADNSTTTPVIRNIGPAAHSPSNVLDTSGCGSGVDTFCHPDVVARFNYRRHQVSLYAGDYATGETTTVTLTAYDASGSELDSQTATVIGGAPFAQAQQLAVSDAQGRIAFITIVGGNGYSTQAHVAIDDLSYDTYTTNPAPDFGLGWSQTVDDKPAIVPYVGVRQGFTTGSTIDIVRFPRANTDELTFTASGLPAGVTASFSPATPTGGTTDIELTASPTAPTADTTITVSATDAAQNETHTLAIPVAVRPNFAAAGDPAFLVPAPRIGVSCGTPTSSTVRSIFAPATYGGLDPGFVPVRTHPTVGLTFQPPAGIQIQDPGSVALNDPSVPTPLTITAAPGALTRDTTVPLIASASGYPQSNGSIVLRPLPAAVTNVSPAAGTTPQLGRAGTTVTVTGTGLCAVAGVEFGNAGAVVAPKSISTDGRTLTVTVPPLATTGPLTLISALGNQTPLAQFTVDSFRDTNGFAFATSRIVPAAGLAPFTTLFGASATTQRLSVDPCADVNLGAARCGHLAATEQSPLAAAFAGATRTLTAGAVRDDLAMSVLGRRLATQQQRLAGATVTTPWSLPLTPALATALGAAQLAELSGGFVSAWRSQLTDHARTGKAIENVLSVVRGALARGVPVLVALRHGTQARVVLAYRTESGPAANETYLDVYDADVPFTAAENGATGTLHASRVAASRILLASKERWSDAANGWSGNARTWASGIAAVPASAIAATPQLSSLSTGAIATPTGATVAQVTDDHGHRLFKALGAGEAPDAKHMLPGSAPFAVIGGASPTAPSPVILAGPNHLRETLRATARGAYGIGFASATYTATVRVARGATHELDTVDTDPAGASLGLSRGGPRATARLSLTGRAADGSSRALTVALPTGRGLSDTVSLGASRSALTLTHHGPAVTASLGLTWAGANGLPASVSLGTVTIPRNGRLTLTPPDWRRLARAPMIARLSGGRSVRLNPHPAGLTGVSLRGTKVHGRALTVRARLAHPVTAALGLVAAGVRHGRVVWTRTVAITTRALAGTTTRTLGLPKPGVDSVRVIATLVGSTAGGSPGVTQATASLKGG